MAKKKYDLITELYEESLKEVTERAENWMAFLRSACRNYRLPFDEQLLIHAQRPDAMAVLRMEDWNRKFGRWVKRDSKGIAVFDKNAGRMRLKYYFDISDTKEGRYRRLVRPVPLWEVRETHRQAVRETLANTFGVELETENLEDMIWAAAENAAVDNVADYMKDILADRKGSSLEEADDYSVEVQTKTLLSVSVAFMVMVRCGIDAEMYLEEEDFRGITDFNTPHLANLFGTAVSDISEMALTQIADTIKKLQLEEKKAERTFAEGEKDFYNESEKSDSNEERRLGYERDTVQQTGGLFSSGHYRAGRAGDSIWEVRLASTEISEEREVRAVHHSADAGEAERTSDGDTGSSAEQAGLDHGGDGAETGSEREAESGRHDGVDGENEQYPSGGGGDRAEGNRVRLGWYDRDNEDKSLPFFSNDKDIKALLLATPYLKAGRGEIQRYFEVHEDKRERTEYIQGIFNDGPTDITLPDGKQAGYQTYENVLHLWEGRYDARTAQGFYDWGVIADYFEGMRLLGELRDAAGPLRTVQGQLSFMEDIAGEQQGNSPAFSFTQEIIDYALTRGSGMQNGKYRIYSYFMQGHTVQERVEFLKKEYGIGGRSDILAGTGIGEMHDAKGLKLNQGYKEDSPKILLKWNKVAERISELIKVGRYLSEKEMSYLPEYEKNVLAAEIYSFFYHLPEEVVRPYPYGTEYYKGIELIRPQLEDPQRVIEILQWMEEILEGMVYSDHAYPSMQKTYHNLMDYRDGVYSLFSPLAEHGTKQTAENTELSIAERNYRAMTELAPEVLTGRWNVKTFEAGGPFMTLTVEQIGDNRIAVSHYYMHNGDSIPDPDMEFEVDHEAKALYARTFEQGVPARYEEVMTDGIVDEELEEKLNQFAETWFHNIHEQGYQAVISPRFEEQETTEAFETEKEVLIPVWEKKGPVSRIKTFDLHPEIPLQQRIQYQITDEELGYGTKKEKFQANIMAIQLLKKCEDEDRYATLEEQEVLSGYVGWGGLSEAFDESNASWEHEYLELKAVLTNDEYEAARQSILTAFYTPPVVIQAMYQALINMGLQSGNILEPSCGVGNFIGMKPESLSECRIYGVEIDSISGRIAQQLYQKSTVAVQGYEEAELPDSFFDVAIGNIPFGQFKVSDVRYDRLNLSIHDYFFVKTLDKIRPGGVIAFITSSWVMDKKNSSVRKYIAQRAELLGAIRLPNDTFRKNAGTEVTSDILFFQKRDRLLEIEPDWVYLDADENGITQNSYFVAHPEMVLGEMIMESGPHGMRSTCAPYEDRNLRSLLAEAVENIQAEIAGYEAEELVEEEDYSIPADPTVLNYSFTIREGEIYYRENSRMNPVELSVTGANRVRGMIAVRDCVRELIAYQTEGYNDDVVNEQQKKLNELYDIFRSKYGLLNARANRLVFSDDNSYPLLCSLEILAEDGTLERKADIFTKRTIRPHEVVTKVDTSSEALSLSLAEKACVDMEYICSLTGKTAEEVEKELSGIIFRLPAAPGTRPEFVSEDEYLSGNVRKKLREARLAAETSEIYQSNVEALEKVQPKDLSASEIHVRLGVTWIPEEDIADFIFDLLDTPNFKRWNIKVHFSRYTGEWQIEGKSRDKENVKANNAFGTHRASAYKIIEDSLNLRETRIYDYIEDGEGKKKAVLNKEETSIAQGKQDLIKQAFQEWIWKDPDRRQRLTDYYNENFNAIRPREYDGSHLKFYGMNPEIKLRQHQKNGAARIIYGGNTLLAYVVGAGKTYTMVAAAMESKRLGLCSKSMIVVPNHIIEQFAAEWLQLYPAANLLVATKKDFETKNRKKFCARIATSDIDAVIIGHSQFEKIPLSIERQRQSLKQQLDEILEGIDEAKRQSGGRFTIKQLEKTRKNLLNRLKKLNDQSRKDDMVTFEELGIDRLFVDEADSYKNLYLYTKMRNVAGIAQTEAQKSSDMFMKCRYLDEITGGRGVIFATGTPVSNSMVELYTMQRYLQYHTLAENHLQHFDAWASTFGETVMAIELAPEGTGYRLKTRFSRFYNLPELMTMFREVADIQTADMLNLPVPEAEYRVVKVKASEMQKKMVEELGNRAERVRNGMVDPTQDNMLLITNDGRKLALDQRLANEMLPDEAESKVNACVEEVYRFWKEGSAEKLTQLVFCDLSTPRNDGTFSVYNDVRDKLIMKGIPQEEIAFIHNANTEVQKKELFSKVRRGAVRILMGSTFKMGAGTNVQDRIIASHDLDCPWRPRDLEQRAGRTVRQGNKNAKVDIIRYVTEGTFDAYLYQVIENKQKFISQVMTSKNPARSIEDIDEVALSYAEIKALAAGNPNVKEKMDLDIQVSKLQLLKQSFLSQKYEMQDKVIKYFPRKIREKEEKIENYQQDIEQVRAHTPNDREAFPIMEIKGTVFTEKKEAGQAIIAACKSMTSPDEVPIGNYRGLSMELSYDSFGKNFIVTLRGKEKYHVTLGDDIYGNITRINNEVEKIPDKLERSHEELESLKKQLETAREETKKEFPQEKELEEKMARLGELNATLNIGGKDRVLLDESSDVEEVKQEKKEKEWER